jgi:hypothetical protein
MLSKIVQESVESEIKRWKERSGELTELEYAPLFYQVNEDFVQDELKESLISSQISLLEAELDRKKGMIIKPFTARTGSDILALQKHHPLVRTDLGEVGFNEAIQEDITYLTEQIELIKKMV